MAPTHETHTRGHSAASAGDVALDASAPGRATQQEAMTPVPASAAVTAVRALLAEAREHAVTLEQALAAGDHARIELASATLAKVMGRAVLRARQLPPADRAQVAPELSALRVAVVPLLDGAAAHPTGVYDSERFVSVLGHTNQPASDELRTGRPASVELNVMPDRGPYQREQLVEERENGTRMYLVEEGAVVDGVPSPMTRYLRVVDARGRTVGTTEARGQTARPLGEQVKTAIGRAWTAISRVLGSDESAASGSAGSHAGPRG